VLCLPLLNAWIVSGTLVPVLLTLNHCSGQELVCGRPDTYINTYAVGFPFRISTDYFDDNEIPPQVQYAQTILATYLHNNPDGIGLSGLEDYKKRQGSAAST
jgi:hypothetical protein